MDKGISNVKTEKFFNVEQNGDLKKKNYGCLFNGFNNKIYKLLRNNKKKKHQIPICNI